jgi:hypothetical protein
MRPSTIANALLALLAPLALSFAGTAGAQMYKWVDNEGRISYSDTPPPKEAKDVKQRAFGDGVGVNPDDLPPMIREAVKSNPVTLYVNNCGEACDGGRAMLNKRGIIFTERNPETDKAGFDALMKITGGQQTVPVLTVGSTVLKGFAEGEWQAALTQAGYPRVNPGLKPRPAAPPAAAPAAAPTK